MAIAYRKATKADFRFIEESWIESYRCAHAAGLISMDDWHDIMLDQVHKVLNRPGVTVHVAYNPNDDSISSDIYGWLAVETDYRVPVRARVNGKFQDVMEVSKLPLVHYCFVKHTYRRMGIARELFRLIGVEKGDLFNFTCKTAVVTKLRLKHGRWLPLVARYTKSKPESENNDNASNTDKVNTI